MKQKAYLLFPLLLTGALFITTSAMASQKNGDRVGKTASITLDRETQVGDVVLQPGEYTVQHRAAGDHDIMVFQRTKTTPYNSIGYAVGKPQQVQCRMEPLAGKVLDTTVSFDAESKVAKLSKIDIAGETVEHLF